MKKNEGKYVHCGRVFTKKGIGEIIHNPVII